MKTEIKERIELVQQGKVPNKYRYTRAGIMPEDWIKREPYKAANLFRNYINKKHGGAFEVLSVTQEQGIIPRTQIDIDIKYDEDNVPGYKKVDHGDFVISLRSFQGGIEYSGYEGLVSPAYTVLKPVLPIVNEYYRAYFKTEDFISRLNAAVYGIRDGKQIGYEDFGELILHYPPISEQEKIAEIFIQCDKVIKLKKYLIEEKKRQKKWLMQKLLNLDSGVRLPGFEGEWNLQCFSECFSYIRNGFVGTATPYYCSNGVKYIQGMNIKNGRWLLSEVEHISEEFHKSHPNSVLCENDVVVVQSGHIGDCAVVPKKLEGSNCHAIIIMTPLDVINPYYCAYYINSEYCGQALVGLTTGNTVKHILASDMKKFTVRIPGKEEQNAIADILLTADHEIDLLEQELAQWQTKKKSLMQLLLTGILRVNI